MMTDKEVLNHIKLGGIMNLVAFGKLEGLRLSEEQDPDETAKKMLDMLTNKQQAAEVICSVETSIDLLDITLILVKGDKAETDKVLKTRALLVEIYNKAKGLIFSSNISEVMEFETFPNQKDE